jgi:hypothetical protein
MPFQYPKDALVRRHGPLGYRHYQSYKPWLRDEFTFRCVYCLWRERWYSDGDAAFGVDHVLPQTSHPEHVSDYGNLTYACNQCNAIKREQDIAWDPCREALGQHLLVQESGTIRALTPKGDELIALCRLNRPRLTEARRIMLELVRVLRASDQDESRRLLQDLLGFPENLPDLIALNPPGGNTRPEGLASACLEQRKRGELPATY